MEILEATFLLSDLIYSPLELMKPHLANVNVIEIFEVEVSVHGDFFHLQETCLNIIKNALEAMDSKGNLIFKIYQTRKNI